MVRIATYEFDDTSGAATASDSGGSGHDATAQNGASTNGSGQMAFDGQDDYLEIGADPAFGLNEGAISLSFTADSASGADRPWGDPGAQTLFSVDSKGLDAGGHLTIFIDTSGAVVVRHQSADGESYFKGGSVVVGQPTQVSYSFGPQGSVLEVNGTVVATGTEALGMAGQTEPIVIGASQAASGDGVADNLTGFFDGTISTLSIYNAPLAVATPACFVAGTMIATASGPRRVETLGPGDGILTVDHGVVPLVRAVSRRFDMLDLLRRPALRPFVLRKGILGNTRPLRLSRQHAVLLHSDGAEVLVRTVHLPRIFGGAVRRADGCRGVHYVHLLLPHHALIHAEGVVAESLLPRGPGLGAHPCRRVLRGAEVTEIAARNGFQAPHRQLERA